MVLGNTSPVAMISSEKDVVVVVVVVMDLKYLSFMLGSTLSSSLNSMPHGFPGVASSMNLPNSG